MINNTAESNLKNQQTTTVESTEIEHCDNDNGMFMEPIVLDQKGKEVFVKIVQRPAQPNQKLIDAFRRIL